MTNNEIMAGNQEGPRGQYEAESEIKRAEIMAHHKEQLRKFRAGERDIPMYVTIRQKSQQAKVLKLLRKGLEDPAVAVDDELGLLGVLGSEGNIKLFLKHLNQKAANSTSLITFEDISDTLDGKPYDNKNVGSSSKIEIIKFFARMGGMRIEFILHTSNYPSSSFQINEHAKIDFTQTV